MLSKHNNRRLVKGSDFESHSFSHHFKLENEWIKSGVAVILHSHQDRGMCHRVDCCALVLGPGRTLWASPSRWLLDALSTVRISYIAVFHIQILNEFIHLGAFISRKLHKWNKFHPNWDAVARPCHIYVSPLKINPFSKHEGTLSDINAVLD